MSPKAHSSSWGSLSDIFTLLYLVMPWWTHSVGVRSLWCCWQRCPPRSRRGSRGCRPDPPHPAHTADPGISFNKETKEWKQIFLHEYTKICQFTNLSGNQLKNFFIFKQGITMRCRLSRLTNSSLVYEPKCGERGGGALWGLSQWVQLYTWAQINLDI